MAYFLLFLPSPPSWGLSVCADPPSPGTGRRNKSQRCLWQTAKVGLEVWIVHSRQADWARSGCLPRTSVPKITAASESGVHSSTIGPREEAEGNPSGADSPRGSAAK